LAILVGKSKGLSQSNASDVLPGGNWTLSSHPYMGPGYYSRPVVVTAVVSNLSGSVSRIMLENNSTKTVSAVKLEWYLMTEQDRSVVLQQGQTPFVAPSGALPPGKYKELEFPIVSFAKIYQPLLKNNVLAGDYRIEVGVAEIQYDDGSSWTAKTETAPAAESNAAHAIRVAQCPGQRCQLQSTGKGYTCVQGATDEVCSNCIKSCINALCGRPMPTCPPGGGGLDGE
jgi:hypothetical protein